jgi:predicted ATPase
MHKGIHRIELAGFKSLAKVDLSLGNLNVLIGPNGAGKSNLLSVFRFLNALTEQDLQTFVARQGGASALLHYGPKETPRISLGLHFLSDTGANAYRAEFTHVSPDVLIFTDEALEYKPEGEALRQYDLPGGHHETRIPWTIDKGGLEGKTARFIKYRLDRWRSYHFHDTSDAAAVKQTSDLQDNRYLHGDAGNIAAFLYMLKVSHSAHYGQIRDTVRMAFPLFDDFVTEPSRLNPNKIILTWRERGHRQEFGPHQLSDGTLRFICLATLLLQPFEHPNAPYTITIDEPELGLHPYAVTLLASMLESASKQVQIIVSTQSASLLGAIDDPSSVVVVERKNGASELKRLEPKLIDHWLDEYSLGDVWEKGVIGGRPHS